MSQENVEIVGRYFQLIDRMLGEYWVHPVPLGEYPETEEAFKDVQADAEWKPPHMEAFRGKDAWLAAVSDWLDAADHWRILIEDVSDLGGDQVLVESRNAIRGKGSGLEIEQAICTVVTVREGKIAAIWDFTDRQTALEAAGLSEWAMSQENVDLVRRIYAEVTAHSATPPELVDPDLELDQTDATMEEPEPIRGFEASDKSLREYWETFEDFQVELEEVIHADEEQVVTCVRDGGRIKGSDAEVWNRFFHVWTIGDRKIIRLSIHLNRSRALEAAGLSE